MAELISESLVVEMDDEKTEQTLLIVNELSKPMWLILEPWVEEHWLEPGEEMPMLFLGNGYWDYSEIVVKDHIATVWAPSHSVGYFLDEDFYLDWQRAEYNEEEVERIFLVGNEGSEPILLMLEPEAEGYWLGFGQTVEVCFRGRVNAGDIKVVIKDDGIVFDAPVGSVAGLTARRIYPDKHDVKRIDWRLGRIPEFHGHRCGVFKGDINDLVKEWKAPDPIPLKKPLCGALDLLAVVDGVEILIRGWCDTEPKTLEIFSSVPEPVQEPFSEQKGLEIFLRLCKEREWPVNPYSYSRDDCFHPRRHMTTEAAWLEMNLDDWLQKHDLVADYDHEDVGLGPVRILFWVLPNGRNAGLLYHPMAPRPIVEILLEDYGGAFCSEDISAVAEFLRVDQNVIVKRNDGSKWRS